MYEAYFTKRLLEALTLAEQASDAGERSVHIQASRFYRNLLQFAEKRRSVRNRTAIRATLEGVGSDALAVVISDLSSGGFRTTVDQKLRPGTPVTLQMEGFTPVEAFVVWQDGDEVGCRFVSELHPAIVDAAIAVSART